MDIIGVILIEHEIGGESLKGFAMRVNFSFLDLMVSFKEYLAHISYSLRPLFFILLTSNKFGSFIELWS